MTTEFYRRLNRPLILADAIHSFSTKLFFNDIQERIFKDEESNRCQSADEDNLLIRIGHVLMNEKKMSAQTASECAVKLLEEDFKGVVTNMTVQVEKGTAKLPKSLFVLFLYNLLRKHVLKLTSKAILRLHISESMGRIKGIVKIDGYGSGEPNSWAKLEEEITTDLNPRLLDAQNLVNMMHDAGHASYITNYNEFCTGFQIGIHNTNKYRIETRWQKGEEKNANVANSYINH